jgi:hypothetical protein
VKPHRTFLLPDDSGYRTELAKGEPADRRFFLKPRSGSAGPYWSFEPP